MCEHYAGAERNGKANDPGQITNNLSVMMCFRPSRAEMPDHHCYCSCYCLTTSTIILEEGVQWWLAREPGFHKPIPFLLQKREIVKGATTFSGSISFPMRL
jgi:hypothetical protein